MRFLKRLYRDATNFVSGYASKNVGDVVSNVPDLSNFSFDDDYLRKQSERMRELETLVARYEIDLSAARQESDNIRNLAQYLKVQTRGANQKRFAAEKNVGAFDKFMRSRVCDLIEKGVNPLDGGQAECYVFVDRHGNIASMSRAARKVLGYDESRHIDYHDIISAAGRMELAGVKTDKVVGELSLKMPEGVDVVVKDVHVSPLLVGEVYAGAVVDFRGLTLLEKTRAVWLESRARSLIEDVQKRFRERGIDLGVSET